jgi:hypothetical protein
MAQNNKKPKPAFPGRASSLGYEPGMTKLEWIATQILAGGVSKEFNVVGPYKAVKEAQLLIKICEAAEAGITPEDSNQNKEEKETQND